MSGSQVALDGPFEVEVKVHITDGSNTGVVTVGLANGTIPTKENILDAVKQAKKAATDAEMRLMDRHEFVCEMLGAGRVAVPGPKVFANPEAN